MTATFARSTKQRGQVLAVLGRLPRFVSAQELFVELKQQAAPVGLSTVYRTLSALAAQGVVDVILREDGESLYRACNPGHHHHLVCRQCGNTTEIQAAEVEQWAAGIAAEHGFSQVEHTLEIVGVCRRCR